MADVITSFKLETTQYDSKLRDAAKGLSEFVKRAENGGKSFTDFSQKSIQAAKDLGAVASGATNLKDKVKDLVGAYNDAAKAYNKLSQEQQQSDFGKALAQSIGQLSDRIKEAKQELYGLNSEMTKTEQNGGGGMFGGMFGGEMTMASFKGNVYAMAAEKGAEALSQLKNHIQDILKESMKMAQEAEGVEMAYRRLNQPDLLANLKEATHGTVSELELMKQAVKFDNFNLPLKDLGTYLAFAQQKAKDTGESIDYLVTSIVNGLGRQSKQILDNLGISAAELTKRMNEGKTMTEAVGEIIREEMAKAGDYVETAAERAAKATVAVQDEMLKLGRMIGETFGTGSIEELSAMLEMRLIKDLESIVGLVGDLSTGFGLFGKDATGALKDVADVAYTVVSYIWQLASGLLLIRAISWGIKKIKGESGNGDGIESLRKSSAAQIGASAQNVFDKSVLPEVVITPDKNKTKGGRGGVTTSIEDRIRAAYEKATDNALANADTFKATEPTGPSEMWKLVTEEMKNGLKDNMANLTEWTKDFDPYNDLLKSDKRNNNQYLHSDGNGKYSAKMNEVMGGIANGVSGIVGGLESLGIEIPDGIKSVLSGMQGISSILTGIATTILAIQAITSADAILPWASGGIVRAANGFNGVVPGFNYSGDMIPARLNAGEVVLNKAQANSLAGFISAAEQGGGGEAISRVNGEQIYVVLSRYLRRSGRGELATWK